MTQTIEHPNPYPCTPDGEPRTTTGFGAELEAGWMHVPTDDLMAGVIALIAAQRAARREAARTKQGGAR